MHRNVLRRSIHLIVLLALLVAALPAGGARASAPAEPPPPGQPLTAYRAGTGKLSFVSGKAGAPLLALEASALADADAGRAALARYAPAFGVQNPARDLALERVETNAGGGSALRYQQRLNGVPVLGGELIVNRDRRGNVLSVNGEVSPEPALPDLSPNVSAAQAAETALAGAQTWHRAERAELSAGQPELWLYDERLFKESQAPLRLVWRLEIRATGQPVNELVLVDAATGEIALHFNQVDAAWTAPEQEATLPEPTAPELTLEPTAEPTLPEPTAGPTSEPTAEPSPEFTAEPTAEVTPEPTLEPAEEET